jgi:hypothetical protein
MDDLQAMCDDHLQWFKNGDREAAFFGLIETLSGILPHLIKRFREEPDEDMREFIVEVVLQHRNPESVLFLAGALYDRSPFVWKAALDGLVMLGGSESMEALGAARSRIFPNAAQQLEFLAWINEALQQMNHST